MGRQKQNIKIPRYIIELIQDYADTDFTMCEILKKYPDEDVSEFHESTLNKSYIIIEFLIKELGLKAKLNKKSIKLYEYWNGELDISEVTK